MNPENKNLQPADDITDTTESATSSQPDQQVYQYSQMNDPVAGPLPATALPPIDNQPQNKIPINGKIGPLSNWLIVIGILVAYLTLVVVLSDEVWRIFILVYVSVVVALLINHIRELKQSEAKAIDDRNRTRMLALMASNVIMAQVVYYFSLKKTKPAMAHTSVRLGWKVIGIWFVGAVISVAIEISISWGVNYAPQFNAGLEKIKQEAQVMQVHIKDGTINANNMTQMCQNIIGHVQELRRIPAHPDAKVQSLLAEGEASVEGASKKCIEAVEQNSSILMDEADVEMKKGAEKISAGIELHNKGQ